VILIIEARCVVTKPMVQNRFVVEVADTQILKATVGRLRNIDGVKAVHADLQKR